MDEGPRLGDDDLPLVPLAPFIASLAAVGIRAGPDDYRRVALALSLVPDWGRARLGGILASLLVRDPERLPDFRRQFEAFFPASPVDAAPVDPRCRAEVLAFVTALGSGGSLPSPSPDEDPGGDPGGQSQPVADNSVWRRLRRWLAAVLVLILVLGVAGDCPKTRPMDMGRIPVEFGGNAPPIETPGKTEEPRGPDLPPPERPAQRFYPEVPRFGDLEPIAPEPNLTWVITLVGGLGLAAAALAVLLLRRRLTRAPPPGPSGIDLALTELHFDPGLIGGTPAPCLPPDLLDEFADAVGRYRDQAPGADLDLGASIAALARSGGIPRALFRPRRVARQVLVLEDLLAEANRSNPFASELARGLAERGVPVLHGWFEGSPGRARTADGKALHLADLDDARESLLALVVSDGKGLPRQGRDPALELLARWPRAAWLDPREERAWDQGTARVARAGLRPYPASAAGLGAVLRGFLAERGTAGPRPDPDLWRGLPLRSPGDPLESHLARLLGDALPWAQCCALVPPPLAPGLAERLRRLDPAVPAPPAGLERLLSLPDSVLTSAGVSLSPPVRAALCRGFYARGPAERAAVLDLLYAAFEAARPKKSHGSLADASWEWRYQRLQLQDERHQPQAVARLRALAETPLGRALNADLWQASPARSGDPDEVIPIPPAPGDRRERAALAALVPGLGRPPGADPEVRALGYAGVLLGVGALVTLAAALWLSTAPPLEHYLLIDHRAAGPETVQVRLAEPGDDDHWRPLGDPLAAPGARWAVEPGRDYGLSLLAGGTVAGADQGRYRAADGGHRRPLLRQDPARPLTRPCAESLSAGLRVWRCPPDTPAGAPWEPRVRGPVGDDERDAALVVGLAIHDPRDVRAPDGRRLIGALLATRSVDWFYELDLAVPQISAAGRPLPAEDPLRETLERLLVDLEPWADRAQVLWWARAAAFERLDPLDPYRPRLARADRLRVEGDDDWVRLSDRAYARERPVRIAALAGLLEEQPSGPAPPAPQYELRLHGSNTLGAELVPRLIESYLSSRGVGFGEWRKLTEPVDIKGKQKDETYYALDVEGSDAGVPRRIFVRPYGSATAFPALLEGRAEVGMASRYISQDEIILLDRLGDMTSPENGQIIAYDGVSIIVHPESSVSSLTIDQVGRIFDCRIRDWSAVGGRAGPIRVYARDDNSGTYDTFKTKVLEGGKRALCRDAYRYEDSARLSADVQQDPGAIGFVGLAQVGRAKPLKLESGPLIVKPSSFAIKTDEYRLARPLFFYVPVARTDFVQGFLAFARGPSGQALVSKLGFVDLLPELSDSAEGSEHMVALYRAALAVAQKGEILSELMSDTKGANRLSIIIYFQSDGLTPDRDSVPRIEQLAQFLSSEPLRGRQLLLLGFSEKEGDYNENCEKSNQRASIVATLLREKGVEVSLAKGYCEEAPLDAETVEGKRMNRRVEVWLK